MVNIILDTDIGCDCDDAGAMAVMHELSRQGYCNILAVTHCTSRMCGMGCIDAINNYYGRDDIAVGKLQKQGFLDQEQYKVFSRAITDEFPNMFRNAKSCEDAVSVLRRVLASQQDQSVVLVAIGPLVNVNDLLKSGPDRYSPLPGIELVAQKISKLCVMGGRFDHQTQNGDLPKYAEWNIQQDIKAAQEISEKWPTPVVFVPFELGAEIKTGGPLLDKGSPDNPVRRAYELLANAPRESWDLCAVHYAIKGEDDIWALSPEGIVSFDDNGVSTFYEKSGGKHRYLYNKAPVDEIAKILDDLLLANNL